MMRGTHTITCPSVTWNTCDHDLPHPKAAEMAPVYPEGGKTTSKHADLWVCCGAFGGLRRKLRLEVARHSDGDLLQGDILDDVPRDTGDENADTAGSFDIHVADDYVREGSPGGPHISPIGRAGGR